MGVNGKFVPKATTVRKFLLTTFSVSIALICVAQSVSDSLNRSTTNKTRRDPIAVWALGISILSLLVQLLAYKLDRKSKLWRLVVTSFWTGNSEPPHQLLHVRAVNLGERDIAVRQFAVQVRRS